MPREKCYLTENLFENTMIGPAAQWEGAGDYNLIRANPNFYKMAENGGKELEQEIKDRLIYIFEGEKGKAEAEGCYDFSIRKKESNIWVKCTVRQMEDGSIFSVFFENRNEKIQEDSLGEKDYFAKTKLKVEEILNNIPIGVAIYEAGDKIKNIYINEGVYPLLGSSKEEFIKKEKQDVQVVLTPEDAEDVRLEMAAAIREQRAFEYTYRSKRPGNKTGWTWIRSKQVGTNNGNPLLYAVLADVTNQKETERRLMLQHERYRILEETVSDLLFDYDVEKDLMVFSFKTPSGETIRKSTKNYIEKFTKNPLVHPDFREKFKSSLIQAMEKPMKGSILYLSRISDGEYKWHDTTYASIADQENKVVNIFGQVKNVHEETLERIKIREKANLDSLTNILNKTALHERIQEYLSPMKTKSWCAFLMLDIDDFKYINDQYGHAVGDEVLKNAAEILNDVFNYNCILGRFGGDEFIVFMKDTRKADVEEKIGKLFGRLVKYSNGNGFEVRCSIGIMLSKIQKEDFKTLFHKADIAMYAAKRQGKNRYLYYDDSMKDEVLSPREF